MKPGEKAITPDIGYILPLDPRARNSTTSVSQSLRDKFALLTKYYKMRWNEEGYLPLM
jgi:hypothetical protein